MLVDERGEGGVEEVKVIGKRGWGGEVKRGVEDVLGEKGGIDGTVVSESFGKARRSGFSENGERGENGKVIREFGEGWTNVGEERGKGL
jgi:hypothetical protein